MTNAQIIFEQSLELMNNGIIGTTGRQITVEYENEEGQKVKELINEPEEIHTYKEWQNLGQQVQKGQKAVAKFTIWMYAEGKKGKLTKEQADRINSIVHHADGSKAQEGDETQSSGHYYMKEAAFFSASQVAPIEQEKTA